jgi:hypothetical protein
MKYKNMMNRLFLTLTLTLFAIFPQNSFASLSELVGSYTCKGFFSNSGVGATPTWPNRYFTSTVTISESIKGGVPHFEIVETMSTIVFSPTYSHVNSDHEFLVFLQMTGGVPSNKLLHPDDQGECKMEVGRDVFKLSLETTKGFETHILKKNQAGIEFTTNLFAEEGSDKIREKTSRECTKVPRNPKYEYKNFDWKPYLQKTAKEHKLESEKLARRQAAIKTWKFTRNLESDSKSISNASPAPSSSGELDLLCYEEI